MSEKEYEKLKHKNTEIVESLQAIVGLVQTKFYKEKIEQMKYQPWDSVSTKTASVEKWCKNPEIAQQIVSFTKGSLFKSYPLNFNSENINAPKTWMIGGQVAAINVQSTKDNFTLINQVFFSLSKNVGYVLKPIELREGRFLMPSQPVLSVDIEFLLGSMLHSLSQQIISELNITVEVFGSFEDDKQNKKYQFKKILNNLINPVFKEEKVHFEFYRPDISFILVKLFDDSELIGRGVVPICALMSGLRSMSLYSNDCKLATNAKLLCLVKQHDI